MQASHRTTQLLLALMALAVFSTTGWAADPGTPFTAAAGPNDLRPGSVLLYNYYTSSANNDTRINITNTSPTNDAFVHFFLVDGATCSVADFTLCVTRNQTASFLASGFDPGITGYIFAVGYTPGSNCPNSRLIGSSRIRIDGGTTILNALAVDSPDTGACTAGDITLSVPLRVPRTLALDSITSVADNTQTLLIVNRAGGNLLTGPGSIGSIFGLLFDNKENGFSFSISGGCQIRQQLSNTFPRTTPNFNRVIPAGETGWVKFWATTDRGIAGAAIDIGPGNSIAARNLHILTTTTDSITIPFFGNTCD